ncbi:unnamed protein product [Lactuca saligna]|uniref:Uncharacterized protein n=1 Tax=Lactuca saligna TaxID=75948 RepID=A0AA36EJ14_LACSI|nr:unnamed protein product [Lactuca saligna]
MPSQDCLHQNTIQLYGLDQEPIDIVAKPWFELLYNANPHFFFEISKKNSPRVATNTSQTPHLCRSMVAISSTTPTTSDIYVGSSHLRPTPWSPHLSSGLLPAMLFSSSYHLLWSCI